jgi:two-component sensor histidine kinase
VISCLFILPVKTFVRAPRIFKTPARAKVFSGIFFQSRISRSGIRPVKYMAQDEDSIIFSGILNSIGAGAPKLTVIKKKLKSGLLIFGFYTLAWMIFIPQNFLFNLNAQKPAYDGITFLRVAAPSYLWAVFTPLVFRLGNRFPVERPHQIKNLALHLMLSILVPFIHAVGFTCIMQIFVTRINYLDYFRNNPATFLTQVTNGFGVYIGLVAFTHASNYFRRYRDREFRLQQAELEALKTQLHPHFLFNTLNAISALVYVSPPDATKTISQLSDLLRLTLRHDKAQEVSLKDELDFLRKYLQIQQTLLQERLEIDWRIEPETLDALVPNMILQPLVENSIRHGIAPKEEGGRIEIFSRRTDDQLFIEIKDDGLGTESENTGTGIGLINTKARLKHLYGKEHKFENDVPENGGWRVRIMLPFREAQEIRK